MTGEKIFPVFLRFALPIMISSLFQRLFNAADSVIVGRFSGSAALAAVGGTSPIVSLFSWGLMGLSVGADVTVSNMFGRKDQDGVRRAVHTAYAIAIYAGLLAALTGIFCSGLILSFMKVPEEIFDWSVLYLRIYSIGLFFNVIYNFGAACLRSGGDSKRPTFYMMSAGLLNVVLNLLLVCIFHMGVAGVAIATAVSQLFAAFLVTITLLHDKGLIRLYPSMIRADRKIAKQIIAIGLPSLVQNSMFCLSNMVIQGSINSFGSLTIAANSAATAIEDFVYVGTACVSQSCVTFTGQNNGAGNWKNVKKVLMISVASTTCLAFTIGLLDNLFAKQLLGFFSTDAEIIRLGIIRLRYVAIPLFLNGVLEVFACSLRGMGSSLIPMITSLTGICGVRLLYIFTIFPIYKTLPCLYLCYPLSWIVTTIFLFLFWIRHYRTLTKQQTL